MKTRFMPRSQWGRLSIVLIVLMPIFIYIGMSFVDFYSTVPAGKTIFQDIITRPGVALSMLAGLASGIAAFFTGIISIRKKDYSILVFLSTIIGFLVLLWCVAEFMFPH